MNKLYNLDGITTQIKRDLDYRTTQLEAWESVEIVTKKDGTPFKTMSKNFKGAKYKLDDVSITGLNYKLEIFKLSKFNGYVEDWINCYNLVKYIPEHQKKKTQNIQPKQPMLEQVYLYDIEDIKEAIEKKKQQLKKNIAELENDLENVTGVYNTALAEYNKIMENIKNKVSKDTSYKIKETLYNTYYF